MSLSEQNPEVELTDVPDGQEEGQVHSISATANTGIENSSTNFSIVGLFRFYIDGEEFSRREFSGLSQDENVSATVKTSIDVGQHSIQVRFYSDLYGVPGYAQSDTVNDEFGDASDSDSASITIVEEQFTAGDDISTQSTGYKDAYTDFVEFEIIDIVDSDSGQSPDGPITFEYPNPAISVDSGSNFAKHEIIGGTTVRQRIGDQPLHVSISGVANAETARELDKLRNAQNATILSDRFPQDSLLVHVVSVSTDPLEDGGAADMKSGQFLYTFDMECVEIHDSADIAVADSEIPDNLTQG